MLRAAAADEESELGQQAKELMAAGELVPDDLIVKLVTERLGRPDAQNGWLLDGFPRTAAQAAAMERAFLEPTKAILLDVPDDVLVERVTGRRADPETGKIYHLKFSPPEGDDKEEVLARLTQRDDDTEVALRKRLETYAANKEAIAAAFSGVLLTVNGNQDKERVWSTVANFLGDAA